MGIDGPRAPTPHNAARPATARAPTLVLAAFVLLALVFFVWRGPMRAAGGGGDLVMVFGSTSAWLRGGNPYLVDHADRAYIEAGGRELIRPASRGSFDLLYPPTTFAVLAPLGLLSWPAVLTAWCVLNMAALAAGVWGIVRALGWSARDPRTWAFTALALAFAPVHTNFVHGQTGLAAFGLIGAAVGLRRAGRGAIAGVALGLACAIKPQVAGAFFAYELFRGRWKAAAWSAGTIAAAAAVGVGRLAFASVDWIHQYRDNIRVFFTDWVGNPTPVNRYRYQMLNLHYPLHHFIDDRTLVTILVWAFVGVCGAAYVLIQRGREDRGEMTALSLASVASLLVVYHRFYDAAVMLFAVAFVVDELAGRRTDPAACRGMRLFAVVAAGLGLACLFVPGAAVLFILKRDGMIPSWITGNVLWDWIVMPHQVWALVVVGAAMLAALALSPPRGIPEARGAGEGACPGRRPG